MFLVHVFNYNGLDSNSACCVWDGKSYGAAVNISKAGFYDFVAESYSIEIQDTLESLRDRIEDGIERAEKDVSGTPLRIFMTKLKVNDVLGTND